MNRLHRPAIVYCVMLFGNEKRCDRQREIRVQIILRITGRNSVIAGEDKMPSWIAQGLLKGHADSSCGIPSLSTSVPIFQFRDYNLWLKLILPHFQNYSSEVIKISTNAISH